MIRKKLGEITGTVKEVMASGPPRPLTAPGAHLFLTSGGGAGEQCWGQPGVSRRGRLPGREASGIKVQDAFGKEGELRLSHWPASHHLG